MSTTTPQTHPTTTTTSTTSYPPSDTFTQKEWGVQFRAPRVFGVGHDNADRGAPVILIGHHDYIELARFTHILSAPVTNATLYQQKERLDRGFSQDRHQRISGTGNAVDDLPAVSYPPLPGLGGPPGTQVRLTYVFSGRVEYKVLCSSTPAHRAQLNAACDEVLATITFPKAT